MKLAIVFDFDFDMEMEEEADVVGGGRKGEQFVAVVYKVNAKNAL